MKSYKTSIFLALGICSTAWATENGSHSMTHHMMMLVIQLGVILFAAKWGRILFERLNMPGVLGELAAGMVIGPYTLGQLQFPGFAEGLFPPVGSFPVSIELYGLCSIAAVVLLFMVGLETDLKLFLQFSLAGTVVGIGGITGSFLLGDLVTVWFFNRFLDGSLTFMSPPALFMGVLSSATSVGITAKVLAEKRKLQSPEGVTVLAGAVIDDVLGIILLAVILGFVSTRGADGTKVDWHHIGMIAVKAVGIWLGATVLGLVTAHRISRMLKGFRQHSSIAIMSLGLALILAGLFEEAGLAMIIGAYVMGLALSQTDISPMIQEKLGSVFEFLVPVFFCVMGMMVDFRALSSPAVISFGLVYSLVAIVAKIAGCSIPALFFNFNKRGALRIGVGMVPRGEVALIIAGIGLSEGILNQQQFGVAILMTVVTTVIAPIQLVRLFKNDISGLKRDIKSRDEASIVFPFPSIEIASLLSRNIRRSFEAEGFFVHVLEHQHQFFQLRKDDMVISMHQDQGELIFDCGKREAPLVNAAVYEELAEFEKMVKELGKPIDRDEVGKKLQMDQTSPIKTTMKLDDIFHPACMEPALKGNTKSEILEEMVDNLARGDQRFDREAVLKALREREEVMSTGMQHGIALPHARLDDITELTAAAGLKKEGIDFNSIDGEPSQIFILELIPTRKNAPHIQFMSTISQQLNEKVRAELLTCSSAEDMYRILTRQEN